MHQTREEEDETTKEARRETNAAQHRRVREEEDEVTREPRTETDAAQHSRVRGEKIKLLEGQRESQILHNTVG